MTESIKTDKQIKFVELLYAKGMPSNLVKRGEEIKEEAGYSAGSSIYSILKSVQDDIIEKNKWYFVLYSSESINALQEVVRTPTKLGSDNIIKAANSILDRTGFGKKETQEVEIKADKGIVILPPKV